ncbi:MAG: M48 family metallopeptidase [Bacteroidota bacterium]
MISLNHRLLLISVFLLLFSCSRVPITGRRQLNMIPESQLISLSASSYDSFLKNHSKITTGPDAAMVKRVGDRISNGVVRFLNENKMGDRVGDYQWEFNLVKDSLVNAWCMPGGKVVVYSGILPVTKDEQSLAIVMGHEIAHAVARHGNERMSQGLMVMMGGIALDMASQQQPDATRELLLQSYGVGSQLGVLAYSRKHETEADKLGMVFAAMAGYDPTAAIGFWERMAVQGGTKPPEFLSTHPSDETRVRQIKEFLPTAKKYYKGS